MIEAVIARRRAWAYFLMKVSGGSDSSRPVKESAIYRSADAMVKIRAYDFPVQVNDATRDYFGAMAKLVGPAECSTAMAAAAADPAND